MPRSFERSADRKRVDPFDVSWRERMLVLGAAATIVLAVIVLGMVYASAAAVELIGLIPVSLFAAGKFLPIWGISGQSNFGPYELGAVIWFLDTFTVITIVYALEAFYRIRPLKRALDRLHANAALVLAAYPRIRKMAVVGVALFVLFPVAGTGAIGGSFIGILLGMHRARLIAAVSGGGFLGGFGVAFAAVHFESSLLGLQAAQEDPLVKVLVVGAAAVLVALAAWGLGRAYKRALALAEASALADPKESS